LLLDLMIKRALQLGARLARPGEFSERAFLNDKLDLAQAEAIADLINASSEQAARSAIRSLQGEFSNKVNKLVESLIYLRMYVEAAIDFPEEEIDFLADTKIVEDAEKLLLSIQELSIQAKQGSILREGITLVIAGRPNAGKSSLLNALAQREAAIVTDIAGTTRDILKEAIHLDGVPLHIIDTAGLRDTQDVVEMEGIKRAKKALLEADRILLVVDVKQKQDLKALLAQYLNDLPQAIPVDIVFNKIDSAGLNSKIETFEHHLAIYLSAKTGEGIDLLKSHLLQCVGFDSTNEGTFIARRRHLDAIEKAESFIQTGLAQLKQHKAGELFAEDLRQAQNALSEITGEFHSDDLLGRIFSSFCIGK
ncbi:MAG: thdF, partial [Gammaproteobacteria bacterium]|nr:thdF [Gammaproteobacteria bacterium]